MYGGEQTTAPTAPPTAVAASLSRRDPAFLLDADHAGRHGEVTEHHDADDDALADDEGPVAPARRDQGGEGEREADGCSPRPGSLRRCWLAWLKAGRIFGSPGAEMAKAKTPFR